MKWFEAWLDNLAGGDAMTLFSLHALLVVFAIVVFNFVLRRVLARFGRAASKASTSFWELALIASARRPLSVLAWVVGISFVGQLAHSNTNAAILAVVHPVRVIGVIVCLGWFLTGFIGNAKEAIILRRTASGASVDRTTTDAIAQLLRIAVWIATILVALQSLGFSVKGVLAFGGIGGIAIGFAAKDLLANFFGSLMIYFDRPFAVGEWVRSPDKQIEGTVEDIGWRLTRIRTFDRRPLYVPNAVFTTITVENPSRMSHRRVNETIGLRYDDIGKVSAIVDDIDSMIRAHSGIDDKQPVVVNFDKFNDFSLDIVIRALSHVTGGVEFQMIKQDILLKIADIIARHGAEIAFPTRVNLTRALPPEGA
ncbi:MAG: mechanosensitive ion channel family protein [Azoarcus sp.]|jgi:MscS family membrane protein|nr:mechanosensitive ion channel family protein [Azoarcus sp.]